MTKKKVKKFRTHAILEVDQARRLELMFSSTLERVTVRAVLNGIPQRPYSKSEIFYDTEGAYFVVSGGQDTGELSYTKLYLDRFKRVRG